MCYNHVTIQFDDYYLRVKNCNLIITKEMFSTSNLCFVHFVRWNYIFHWLNSSC